MFALNASIDERRGRSALFFIAMSDNHRRIYLLVDDVPNGKIRRARRKLMTRTILLEQQPWDGAYDL